MKARAQTVLGITLLGATPLAAGVLYASGVQLVSADFKKLSTTAGGEPSGGLVGHFTFHWSLVVLMIVALFGLWLLTRSKNDKPAGNQL